MTGRKETDHLIAALSEGLRTGGRRPRLETRLPFVVVSSLALAIASTFTLYGAADGLGHTLAGTWFYRKLACMLLVAAGAWVVLSDLSRPGCPRARIETLLPGTAALILMGLLDFSNLGLGGRMPRSAPNCMGAIATLSLPSLALILFIVRRHGAATRPHLAGAAAGLLSGALGGSAYALACRNDGGLFVMVWYGAAIGIAAGAGALLGKRVLAW